MPIDPSNCRADFEELYNGCASWLYSYLLSLLQNPHDAEEVLQETAKLLWEKFDRYHPGTEFRAWACRVAHFKALKHRERSRRHPVSYSDLLFGTLDEEAVLMADTLDARAAALSGCLEKLPEADRRVIGCRYAAEGSVEQVAQMLACSTRSAYRTLTRIHDLLFECVNRVLSAEGIR